MAPKHANTQRRRGRPRGPPASADDASRRATRGAKASEPGHSHRPGARSGSARHDTVSGQPSPGRIKDRGDGEPTREVASESDSQRDGEEPSSLRRGRRERDPQGKTPGRTVSEEAAGDGQSVSEVGPRTKTRKRTADRAEISNTVPREKGSKRPRSSQPSDNAERTQEEPSRPKARRRPDKNLSRSGAAVTSDDVTDAEPAPSPDYQHLVSRTRHIPRSVISAKWMPLDEASASAALELVSDTYRPVLLRLQGNESRHQQAHQIFRAFASRLQSKLRKGIPFPPPLARQGGSRGAQSGNPGAGPRHVDEFNSERVIDSIQSLESSLTPLLHSVSLLKGEKEKEEAALERDYEALWTLETNAKTEARVWKEKARRVHSLALKPRGTEASSHAMGDATLELITNGRRPPLGIFKGFEDGEIASLTRQLGSHLESMRGNLGPVEDLLKEATKCKALLHSKLGPLL